MEYFNILNIWVVHCVSPSLPLPRGSFAHYIVYSHPRVNVARAAEVLSSIHRMDFVPLSVYSCSDFNQFKMAKTLKNYHQFTCATRHNKTLDLCFGAVPEAYRFLALPPLGTADLSSVLLAPVEILKTEILVCWNFSSVQNTSVIPQGAILLYLSMPISHAMLIFWSQLNRLLFFQRTHVWLQRIWNVLWTKRNGCFSRVQSMKRSK